MIKFFRKIRQNLLSKGKTGKPALPAGRYLKYAIGEIILVVIGILIAVAINDANNASKNKQKIETILLQIQEDILVDIKDSKRISNHFIRKDSLARKVYNDLLTVESSAYELRPYDGYVNFSINRGGYDRLKDNLENLPEKYDALLSNLNNIYVVLQDDINDGNANLIAQYKDARFNRAYTQPEHAKHLISNFSTKEAKKYLLDDPFLKNKTAEYMTSFHFTALVANLFRVKATALYKEIDSLLGNQDTELSELLKLTPNEETIAPFLGNYNYYDGAIFTDHEGTVMAKKLSIKFENNQLFIDAGEKEYPMYWHEDRYFFAWRSAIFEFFENEKGVQFLRISNGVINQILVKE